MRKFFILTFISATLGLADTQELRSTIDQWVGVMESIHKEKSRWAREREVLTSSKDGLKEEIADLNEKIAELNEKAKVVSAQDETKLLQKRSYDEAREKLSTGLDSLMKRLPELFALIPESYMKENDKLAAAEQKWLEIKDAEQDKELGHKVNLIVTLLGELESFNQKVWTVSETHTVDGQARILTTAYLGLGAAYSTDEKGEVALIGHPSSKGWSFEKIEDEKVGAEINKFIITATGAGELELSKLPIEIK